MPARSIRADARSAAFHAQLRWIGAPLLVSGGILFFWALGMVPLGAPAWLLLLTMVGALMGLTCFGVNHDTAIALALRVHQARQEREDSEPILSAALDQELNEELTHNRDAVLAMRAVPLAGIFLPLVAVGLQGGVCWYLAVLSGGIG